MVHFLKEVLYLNELKKIVEDTFKIPTVLVGSYSHVPQNHSGSRRIYGPLC